MVDKIKIIVVKIVFVLKKNVIFLFQHSWEWRYSGGERSPMETEYWLLSVQAYGQVPDQAHHPLERRPQPLFHRRHRATAASTRSRSTSQRRWR